MKFQIIIIQLTVCFLSLTSLISGQNPPKINDDPAEFRELPKINDGNIQGKIRKRLLQNLCRQTADCEQYTVKKIESSPRLPEVDVYLITKPYHFSAYSLKYKNKIYTSVENSDFERFLKDYKILSKADLLNAFLDVYKYFKLNDAAINPFYIVGAQYVEEYSDNLRGYETGFEKIAFQSIHQPQLKKSGDDTTEIEFYLDNPLSKKIVKIQATLSAKHYYQEKTTVYRQEKPVVIE